MALAKKIGIMMGAALALVLVAPFVGSAADARTPVRASSLKAGKAGAATFRMIDGIGSFTPAAADSRRAIAFGRGGLVGQGFRFTPSSAPGNRRAVTVAIRARNASPATSRTFAALVPSAYNLGVAVGWRRFALTGDVARVEGGLLPLDRELADVGLSYAGNKWSTRLQLGAERALGFRPRMDGSDEAYSVDLGGSYALTRNLEVTGGLRYKMQRDRLERMADERHDSQAVYVGTAFKF